jgi:hypothetical protein
VRALRKSHTSPSGSFSEFKSLGNGSVCIGGKSRILLSTHSVVATRLVDELLARIVFDVVEPLESKRDAATFL